MKKDYRPILVKAIATAQESGEDLGDIYNFFREQWDKMKLSREMSWEKAHRRKPNGYWNELLLAIRPGESIYYNLATTHTKYGNLRSILHNYSKTDWILSSERVSDTIIKITHYEPR